MLNFLNYLYDLLETSLKLIKFNYAPKFKKGDIAIIDLYGCKQKIKIIETDYRVYKIIWLENNKVCLQTRNFIDNHALKIKHPE